MPSVDVGRGCGTLTRVRDGRGSRASDPRDTSWCHRDQSRAVGAFWLRYRAPIRDRDALGIAGRPAVALVLAGGLLVAAASASYLPGAAVEVAVQLVMAAIALVWLRRTLHVGLLEEAFEIEIGDDIVCANCGATTRRHTFCGNCGIALHALPKGRQAPRDAPTVEPRVDPPR